MIKELSIDEFIITNEGHITSYSVQYKLFGQDITINFDTDEMDNPLKTIQVINNNLKWLANNMDICKKYICDTLLETKNDAWLDDDDAEWVYEPKTIEDEEFDGELEPLTEEQFIKRLTPLTRIRQFNYDFFTIYFEDNNIFWGHCISLDIGENKELLNAMFQ